MSRLNFRAWTGYRMLYNRAGKAFEFSIREGEVYELEMFEEHRRGHTCMQGVGITDIEGKEIYEGDIVLVTDAWEGEYGVALGELGQVLWDKEGAAFIIKVPGEAIPFCFNDSFDLQVVGNIYENPEILSRIHGDDQI